MKKGLRANFFSSNHFVINHLFRKIEIGSKALNCVKINFEWILNTYFPRNLHWLDSKLQQTALFFKRLFKLDSRIACRAAFKKEIQKIDWFIQLFYPQNRPSLKNLEMSSFNSRPNSIRMHCPNCFSQMETRVEIVSRWFGPFAALWNKFLFFCGLLHFYFGSNQNWSVILTYNAYFGINGSYNRHTCPNCNYEF